MDSISIKEVRTPGDLKLAQAIRVRVLEDEQGFPHDLNVDVLDESADHVLVLDDGVPVATARLTGNGEEAVAKLSHRSNPDAAPLDVGAGGRHVVIHTGRDDRGDVSARTGWTL